MEVVQFRTDGRRIKNDLKYGETKEELKEVPLTSVEP